MAKAYYIIPVIVYIVVPVLLIAGIIFSYKKKIVTFRVIINLLLFLFGMFIGTILYNEFIEDPERQQTTASLAEYLLGCTTMLREGETQKAIGLLDEKISSSLIGSVWERDMENLPPEIMDAWQSAKVYYDKYEVSFPQYGPNYVADVREKLKLVPWSQRETIRREFEAKYKTGILQTAPKLDISQWIGQSFSLNKLQGKVVLLDFWGLGCKPCIASLPNIQKLHEKFRDKAFTVLAVTCDRENSEKISKFIKDNNYTFGVGIVNRQTANNYGVLGIPSYYLIDKRGLLVWGPEHDMPSEERIETLLNNSNN